jgi:hypothetical protein
MSADESGLGGDVERCTEVDRLAGQGFCSLTDLSNSPQGGMGVRDNLGRPIAINGIGSLGFQQLGVRQRNPELIIQAVEERLELPLLLRLVGLRVVGRRRPAHTCEPGAVLASDSSERAVGAASRHSVSAKIRMDPPAVRTYSTLPAEIQL